MEGIWKKEKKNRERMKKGVVKDVGSIFKDSTNWFTWYRLKDK